MTSSSVAVCETIVAGVVTVLFRGSGPIEAFWFIAVGLLLLDRWPNGRGPAWETGEATPWPTPMDRQRQLMEEILAKTYRRATVNGVLSPYDGISLGILTALWPRRPGLWLTPCPCRGESASKSAKPIEWRAATTK